MRKLTILFILITATATAFSQASPKPEVTQSDAKMAFAKLKTLFGNWQGAIMGIPIDFTIRPTSSGTTILHEGNTKQGPPDHEITMFYFEGDRLLATHYCDAGNRSNFEGKLSPDGKSIEFTLLELVGSAKGGFLKQMKFSMVDADLHIADFIFVRPDGKPVPLRGEFRRTK